jgi:hypothetical protein
MATATTHDGISLEYTSMGNSEHPAILLISGLGAQWISWAEGFCSLLVDHGYFVVRFDNRDCGHSTQLDGVTVDLLPLLHAANAGDLARARELVPYTLEDMASDAIAVLDALTIDRAHIVGASMGGMIAQTVAIRYPQRCRSLTSIMSTTGEAEYGSSSAEAQQVLMTARPTTRAEFIESSLDTKVWLSKRYADDEAIRADAAASFDRAFTPAGTARQFAAIVASGPRDGALRELSVPTLVIHGLDDTLIDPSGGRRTAEIVPNARLLEVADMGHDRPEPLWPLLTGAIAEHAQQHFL